MLFSIARFAFDATLLLVLAPVASGTAPVAKTSAPHRPHLRYLRHEYVVAAARHGDAHAAATSLKNIAPSERTLRDLRAPMARALRDLAAHRSNEAEPKRQDASTTVNHLSGAASSQSQAVAPVPLASKAAASLPFANFHVKAEAETAVDKAWDKLRNVVYGNAACPCVGLDQVDGEVVVAVNSKDNMTYTADVGARCEAWEERVDPKCLGSGSKPDYCSQKWCYVDPCKCNIATLPKLSSTSATYQGKPLYYSYATCGSEDRWTATNHDTACVNQKSEAACSSLSKCSWDQKGSTCGGREAKGVCSAPVNEMVAGKSSCRCIGISGRKGNLSVMLQGQNIQYPVDIGSQCQAWEMRSHSACKGDPSTIPEWCSQKWCYVDPCDCNLENGPPPKTSQGLATAMFQGKPIFYSYATCGSPDAFPSQHTTACASLKSEGQCGGAGNCAWTGEGCMDKELAETCARDEQERTNPEVAASIDQIIVQKPKPVAGPPTEPVKDIRYSWKSYHKDWHDEWDHGDYPHWKE